MSKRQVFYSFSKSGMSQNGISSSTSNRPTDKLGNLATIALNFSQTSSDVLYFFFSHPPVPASVCEFCYLLPKTHVPVFTAQGNNKGRFYVIQRSTLLSPPQLSQCQPEKNTTNTIHGAYRQIHLFLKGNTSTNTQDGRVH